jgi:hypothetical protein
MQECLWPLLHNILGIHALHQFPIPFMIQNWLEVVSTPCSLGLSATSQQYFSLRTNQPPAISQQYFSLRTNQHQPSATSQTYRLRFNVTDIVSLQISAVKLVAALRVVPVRQ